MRKKSAFFARYSYFLFSSFVLLLVLVYFAVQLHPVTVEAQDGEMQQLNSVPVVSRFAENFDAVSVPQLPVGWTTASVGTGSLAFATSTVTPDSPPNAVFTNDPATVSTAELVSPVIRVGGNSPKVIFRHNYDMEANFDGGVLEIKINNGIFQDIITAGGSFVSGSYNGTLSTGSGNPLPGRRAWTNNSNGYVTTEVNLPAAAFRQNIQFRWLRGTDTSVADVGGTTEIGDGDGRADFIVYRSGANSGWFVLQSGNNSVMSRSFGTTGDIAVAGDYDGDGRENFAVFRPSNGTWYLAANDGSGFEARVFGQVGDIPTAMGGRTSACFGQMLGISYY